MGPILIGTSGWTYKDWRGRFYPARLPQREWLRYYTERFPTVELNVTTYRLPKQHDLVRWTDVPPGFVYTVKLSRLITHRKRPGEPAAFVENYFRAIAPLVPHVANVLAQFPPWFARDDDALANFLARCRPGTATWWSSATRPGTTRRSTRCCARTAPRSACTTCAAASCRR